MSDKNTLQPAVTRKRAARKENPQESAQDGALKEPKEEGLKAEPDAGPDMAPARKPRTSRSTRTAKTITPDVTSDSGSGSRSDPAVPSSPAGFEKLGLDRATLEEGFDPFGGKDVGDPDTDALRALVEGRHADPFSLLGPHAYDDGLVIRVFLPGASAVGLLDAETGRQLGEFRRGAFDGLFVIGIPRRIAYRLRIEWPDGVQVVEDVYSFGPLLTDLDLHLLREGRHRQLAECLGARAVTIDGVQGVRFAVWAPNASRVSVVGDFNSWDGRRNPMRLRHDAGVWEIFLPQVSPGARYKYELLDRHGHLLPQKADPMAREAETAPRTASIVATPDLFPWSDASWMAHRAERHAANAAISIYEVHPASWMRFEEGRAPDWHELAERLIPYVAELGFTHIELLPIMEHPFGGSWGYQPLGLFAPSARFGTPHDFAEFVDRCHAAGIGVILDWVPAHFPSDMHGMARFDGTCLYEYEDPREGFHTDWNTLIYNFSRHEVRGFLIASALHWLNEYHCDGLRVDAVASMLYRDYSRKHDEWIPNVHGGRENLEAIAFLRELNQSVKERAPGAVMIAEESTAWPGVTSPVAEGGLGFDFKWNMGWMHDTLRYMCRDPIYRQWHHDDITFGLFYGFSERFILPLSHDEVVHGKGTLLTRMPGDKWQRFANLRAYFSLMWTHPGKKILFMGGELAQWHEWNHDWQLDWGALHDHFHLGVQTLVGDLNRVYRSEPALHYSDAESSGFSWIIDNDRENSVFAFLRQAGPDSPRILVICNMTPVVRHDYRIGIPGAIDWEEILNSDSHLYGGANNGNGGYVPVRHHESWHDMPHSIRLTLPPLATLILREIKHGGSHDNTHPDKGA